MFNLGGASAGGAGSTFSAPAPTFGGGAAAAPSFGSAQPPQFGAGAAPQPGGGAMFSIGAGGGNQQRGPASSTRRIATARRTRK